MATRRDYVLIATALRAARLADESRTPDHVAYHEGVDVSARLIASALENLDPCFDTRRFLKNAGVPTP